MIMLVLDARAMLLSELISSTDRTAEDFEPLRAAFVKAVLDEDRVMIDPGVRLAKRLPSVFSDDQIDVAPVTPEAAETAGRRLVATLLQVVERPLRTPRESLVGQLPKITIVEAAQRLIAMELAGLWMPRIQAMVVAAEQLADA
jgi:hypothetical protein